MVKKRPRGRPKGSLAFGEEMQQVAFRLPLSLLAQVDEYAERVRTESPGRRVTRADAARDLLYAGLAAKTKPKRRKS